MTIGLLAIGAPWALAALALLPIAWRLARMTPNQPRSAMFAPVRLLLGLESAPPPPKRTPPWLLALRLLALTLAIVAMAGLSWRAQAPTGQEALTGTGPVLVVVDDGWASAPGWDERRTTLLAMLRDADRAGRLVALVRTSAPPRADTLMVLTPARDVLPIARGLAPSPWAPERETLAAWIRQAKPAGALDAIWFTDGIRHAPEGDVLTDALRGLGGAFVRIHAADNGADAWRVEADTQDPEAAAILAAIVRRPQALQRASDSLVAYDARGQAVAATPIALREGERHTRAVFDLPLETRNQVAFVRLRQRPSAAAARLFDGRGRRRRAVILAEIASAPPLIAGAWFLERAIAPWAETRTLNEGVPQANESLALLDDSVSLDPARAAALLAWVRKGGVLVRFAGANLAGADDADTTDDALLAVRPRGSRQLGGALSWTQPLKPASTFPEASPFAGIAFDPDDIRIERHLLTNPQSTGAVWATLEDGSSLVSARAEGKGLVALFHVSANGAWSDLPYSALFVSMLRRILDLSPAPGLANAAPTQTKAFLRPRALLDGFGGLTAPSPDARAIEAAALPDLAPSATHPPGFYEAHALNLAFAYPLEPLPPAPEALRAEDARADSDLTPWLILLATLCLFAEGFLTNPIGLRRGLAAKALVLALLFTPLVLGSTPALAQQGDFASIASRTDKPALAWIRTGDTKTDAISEAGLATLSRLLARRTSFAPAAPVGLNPETDTLALHPLIYWPMNPSGERVSEAALTNLLAYLAVGGVVIFDARDGALPIAARTPARAALGDLLRRLNHNPLIPVSREHTLTKSFYLLSDLPGRWTNHPTFVEGAPSSAQDRVSGIIAGVHDWAGAWAHDANGAPLFPPANHDRTRHERALRFGINAVMYALTGEYKADQVHVRELLERLSRREWHDKP